MSEFRDYQVYPPINPEADARQHTITRRVLAGVTGLAIAATAVVVLRHDAEQDRTIADLERDRAMQGQDIVAQAGEVDRLTGLLADVTDIPQEVIEGDGLLQLDELPGSGQVADQTGSALLEAATVKLVKRPKASIDTGIATESAQDDSWIENCTGIKVEMDGNPYVATAGHCFDISPDIDASAYLTLEDRAANVTAALPEEYGVHLISGDRLVGEPIPAADISVSAESDWALMRMQPSQAFDDLPAVDYSTMLAISQPISGQPTVAYSMPGSSRGELLEGNGVYLGRSSVLEGALQEYDYVALPDATTPEVDACNYGGSGSAVMLPGGEVAGPLSGRIFGGYAEEVEPIYPDNPEFGIINRYLLMREFGVDLDEVPVICAYSVATTDTLPHLVGGFDADYASLREGRIYEGGK